MWYQVVSPPNMPWSRLSWEGNDHSATVQEATATTAMQPPRYAPKLGVMRGSPQRVGFRPGDPRDPYRREVAKHRRNANETPGGSGVDAPRGPEREDEHADAQRREPSPHADRGEDAAPGAAGRQPLRRPALHRRQ